MSVCLASIGADVYAFVSSSDAILVYSLDSRGEASFSSRLPAYNVTLPDPSVPLSSIKLCAIADDKLFILGGFGENPAIVLLNLKTTPPLEHDFAPIILPIAPSSPTTFLATTTSFTAFAGANRYCAIFSGGGELSKTCFNTGAATSSSLSVETDDVTSAGSVLAATTDIPTSKNAGILYDLVNDKVLVYDLNVGVSTVSFTLGSTLNVENPINATGQLLPVDTANSTGLNALFAVGNALYYVAQKNPQGANSNTGSSGGTTSTSKPSSSNSEITISRLNPSLPDRTSQYSYLYANDRVFFADASAGGSDNLNSLVQSAAPSPSNLDNTSSTVASPTDTTTTPEPSENSSNNNTGAIAGGVVGGVIALAIIGALFLWYHRRKRRQPRACSTNAEIEKFSPQNSSHEKGPSDGASAVTMIILTPADLRALDPLTNAGAVILSGAYRALHDEQAILVSPSGTRIPHYAMRTIANSYGETFSLHYFGAESYIPFLRNVAVTDALSQSNAIVRTQTALQLSKPVVSKAGMFQYIWITSPATIPAQSLDYLLQAPGLFDVTDSAFRAWSTLTLLEAVRDLHSAGYVHLDLKPTHFYYPDSDQVDRWKLTGFESAVKANYEISKIGPNAYQAPELTGPHVKADPSADIWSLGWVIFYLLTGEGPQPDEQVAIDRAQQIDVSYGTLLDHMLQQIPEERHSALELAKYWKEAQNMEDDT